VQSVWRTTHQGIKEEIVVDPKILGLVLLGYLLGSLPTAQLFSFALRGRDLSQYGSGTISGSMVWEHVARWAIVPVGLIDIGKAAFPTWLVLQMGYPEVTAATAGLAAVVGHNWPIFNQFKGGRGLSPMLGTWVMLYPWGVAWMIGFLAVGYLLGDSAPWAILGLLTLPLLNHMTGGPGFVFTVTMIMLLLTFLKRIEANRRPLPATGPKWTNVLLRRLIYDRDIPQHKRWLRREPEMDEKQTPDSS
jgi:glycerol-3-phosphate acyltransferase PlsY